MNDCLFPEFGFVTLTEHVVDADLISLDPITSSCVDAEAFLLLDPLAQAVSFQEAYPSVRSQPKSYPWLLNARQVHIAVLLVVPIEDIAQELLEEILTADFGNGARSLKIGWCGMPGLALETASEGLVEIVESLGSPIIESVLIVVSVESLLGLLRCSVGLECIPLDVELGVVELLIDLLIQVVLNPARDILLTRSPRLKAEVPLGYAEVLDRCRSRPVVPDRVVVSRTTRVGGLEGVQAIHVVLVVVSPDVDISTERARLNRQVRSRLQDEIVVGCRDSEIHVVVEGDIRCTAGRLRAGHPASWWITCCHSTSSAYIAKDVAYKTLPETHPPTV